MLIPRLPVPNVVVPTLAHGLFDLYAESPGRFTLLVFYRGLHCPVCAKYLAELVRLLPEFERRGVTVIALSGDTADRAADMAKKVGGGGLRIGHDVSLALSRQWGLFVSASKGVTSIGVEEPPQFAEPGLFLVRPDGTLYYSAVQSMPFARPHFDELLQALDFVIANDYPARGELAGAA
ncbi:MAG: AhpC/TSA family protein [Betaproteobacteria bacterium]|nr:AhpC/TSA family protein [Betaproteobacteria bacterium]